MKPKEIQLWKTYRRSRSIANRNALVEYYLPDLPKIIGSACPRHKPPFVTDEDVSAGSVGLIHAVERYRVRREGAAFRSYMFACVVGAVRGDRAQRPTGEEMGKREHRVKGVPLPTDIEAEPQPADVERDEDRRELAETVLRASSRLDFFLDMLSRQERRVIRLIRYEGMTNKQAARKLRVTPGRVSQLYSSGLAKLRELMLGKGS